VGGVSDRHAAIERREDGYYLCDLDSANGVRVNQQLVKQQRLNSGDELDIGAARLRFEILHGVSTARRTADPLQLTALAIVALLIIGQIGGLVWIFAQPHPAIESRARTRPGPGMVPTMEPPAAPVPATPALQLPPPAPAPTPRPLVLTRMIRIDQVKESLENQRLWLTLSLKAQVGERTLDPRAAGLCVQFYIRNANDTLALWRNPFWLKIPDWENFSTKSFTVLFPGAPNEYGGYVVRSYYRGQLQDAAAKPNSLLAQTPDPMVR
jgi:hypothetical protein